MRRSLQKGVALLLGKDHKIARERYPDYLSKEEIEALERRHVPYSVAVSMVCQEMQCGMTSFYRYYRGILRPFSPGGGHRARFCWEDEVLRAIAGVKQVV